MHPPRHLTETLGTVKVLLAIRQDMIESKVSYLMPAACSGSLQRVKFYDRLII